jgi:Cys-tRNA(Pro)/Cys-tRNA(Cys) deacylase
MTPKLNSLRRLEQLGIAHSVHTYPDTLHSAEGVADHLGVPRGRVYKTQVALRPDGRPVLVMLAGDRQLDTKKLARELEVKNLRMATQAEAERLTGLLVGGISALALTHKAYPVYLDQGALELPEGRMLVSAGRRGVNVELAVADLLRATGASVVAAS